MQAQYAAENLTPLAPEHFLVRKATDIGSTKNLARENPVALVQNILESLDGKASAQQIGEWVIGDVFTEAEWKRWWESTRKALKASGAFSVPVKKTDPIQAKCGRGKAFCINPAECASGKRKTRFASTARRAGTRLDRARVASHGGESRSNGGANSAYPERSRAARRTSRNAGAKHSRT